MLEFVINNYMIFIVIAIVLLLGLFGYMVDKKKYVQYRNEIINEDKALNILEDTPNVQNIASPVAVDNNIPNVENVDPLTGNQN